MRRIAVIGAGAAGLSAAHYLRARGYSRITIFDRRQRVGGKCHTRTIDGRPFELGALVVGSNYRRIRQLLQAAGLDTAPLAPIRLADTQRPGRLPLAEALCRQAPAAPVIRLLGTYLAHCRGLSRPGYCGAEHPALCAQSMAVWLRRRRLTGLGAPLTPYYVGWGYGYLEQISALYVFKLLDMYLRALAGQRLAPRSCPPMAHIPLGYQRLWEIVARPFELVLSADIGAIRRDDRAVEVEWDGAVRRFDALLLACPLDGALRFLDADARERALFSKIHTVDFHSITARVDGLPPHQLVFVGNHMTPANEGHVVSWYRRFVDSGVAVFYAIAGYHLTKEQVASRMAEDLARMGASLREVLHSDRWRYFPHVSPDDLAAGFYNDLERLQGRRRTWYAGELLSFPTVEHVTAYSHRLIEEHF